MRRGILRCFNSQSASYRSHSGGSGRSVLTLEPDIRSRSCTNWSGPKTIAVEREVYSRRTVVLAEEPRSTACPSGGPKPTSVDPSDSELSVLFSFVPRQTQNNLLNVCEELKLSATACLLCLGTFAKTSFHLPWPEVLNKEMESFRSRPFVTTRKDIASKQ